VHAIGQGNAEAIETLAELGPIGVVLDRRNTGNRDLERAIAERPSAREVTVDPDWATFTIVPGHQPPIVPLGSRLAIRGVSVNHKPEEAERLLDGQIRTAWGPGRPQDGAEEVIVDLGGEQAVGAVVLAMGSFSFGFPRALAIDRSLDAVRWQTIWRGETAVATLRAALADPERVPVTFGLGPGSPARYLRLRQTGRDSTVPWWIAELEAYSPQ
jgi:hypothetical protein